MNKKHVGLIAGLGCAALALFTLVAISAFVVVPLGINYLNSENPQPGNPPIQVTRVATAAGQASASNARPKPIATLPAAKASAEQLVRPLTELYEEVGPGVVNIQVYVNQNGRTGQGAGSGFVLDDLGHIVTNNHVVAGAEQVMAVFYDGTEARAEIIGTDPNTDLAVIRVEELPEGAHPLSLADSDQVLVGQSVIAIGNPFGLGGSMTAGIVSAIGRTIPSGATPFSIPHAIQTDAAINPGNSGGPLLNLWGQVIGVNAQIASGGSQANAGVGFAIPSNVVRRVAPSLIKTGSYDWPWLGVTGGPVGLVLAQANNLDAQKGAYLHTVVADSPADRAGLQGSSGETQINGMSVPVGGDVVIEADGEAISSFDDLLAYVAMQRPGDTVRLTILRDGQRQQVNVELIPRPEANQQTG